MAGQEQQIQKKQQTYSVSQQQRDMQMLQEDKQAIAQYQQGGKQAFRVSSKKTLARNFRDYEIYKSLQAQEANAYGKYQEAAEFIGDSYTLIDGLKVKERMNLPGTQLSGRDALLHLCSTGLLEKEVSAETLKTMSEHLTAGQMWMEGENPNAAMDQEMNEAGRACLKEIYFKHLAALDKKYGEKLAGLTPTQYLKAMPALEADLTVVMDMKQFFADYHPADETDERFVLMKKKLDFYAGAWELLQERARTYMDMDPEQVTEKGELGKQVSEDYVQKLRALKTEAKASGAFKAWKKQTPAPETFFEKANARKSKAANRLAEAEQGNAQTLQFSGSLTKENMDTVLAQIERLSVSLLEFMQSASDEQLLKDYVKKVSDLAAWEELSGYLFSAEWYRKMSDDLNAHETGRTLLDDAIRQEYEHYVLPIRSCREKWQARSKQIHAGQKVMKNRMQEIAKYGSSRGRSLMEQEDLLERMTNTRAQVKEINDWKQEPVSFQKARMLGQLARQRNGVTEEGIPLTTAFAESDVQTSRAALPEAFKQLELIKCIRDYKKQHPDAYRLGQSYGDYRNCERLLKRLPLLEELVSLTLRINHLDQYGKTIEEKTVRNELEQRYEQVRETYSNLFRKQALGSEEELKKQLSDEIAGGQLRLKEKREYLLGQKDTDLAVFTEEQLQSGECNLALSFVELPADPAQATAEERATLQRDLKRVKCLMDASEDPEAIGEQTEAALTLLHRFHGNYDRVMKALEQAAFADHALMDQRAQLEQCMLMSGFLRVALTGNGLLERLNSGLQGAEYERDRALLSELDSRTDKIQMLFFAAQRLTLDYARRNGIERLSFLNEAGQERNLTSKSDIREYAENYRLMVGESLDKARVSFLKEQHSEEIKAQEFRARVQNAVGREMLASAKRGTKTKEWSTVSWLGHMAGKPLQLLGWLLRDKRKNHGEENFEKAKAVYKNKLEPVSSEVLDDWQRGDAALAPAVELKKYFSSPLKQSLRTLVQYANQTRDNYEYEDETFVRAMEAMEYYAGIEGIVNSDTTEMEMTFLDTFIKRANEYLENREGVDAAKTVATRTLVVELLGRVYQNLGGTLADTISKEEFDQINANTIAYIEDTTYTSNMEESNIKDIPLFLHEPNINDVRQSTIGDCWLVSAISSVVNTNPDFIRSMFQDLGDGNVLVRMYEAVDHTGMRLQSNDRLYEAGVTMRPVYFKLRKHYETGWGNASDCPWVQLLEKAYALGGFSDHNEMEVRGNRLYNVSDELTLGEIYLGLAHLTGHIPGQFDHERDLPKEQFVDESVLKGMLAGFSGDEYNALEEALREYQSSYNEQIKQQTPDVAPVTYENIREALKNSLVVDMLVRAWKRANRVELIEAPTEQEVQEAIDYYWEKLNANLTRMKNGERLPFTPGQQLQKDAEMVEQNGQTPLERRRMITNYFAMADQYEGPVKHTILTFKQCIEKGGTISLSIPHCVNVIDVKEHNGKYFFLMRDPFNIYNTEYTRDKEGNVTAESDGLTQVFTKRQANRHLMDTKEETVRGAFRGTSWIEAKELYGMISSAFLVTKRDTQIPDHH